MRAGKSLEFGGGKEGRGLTCQNDLLDPVCETSERSMITEAQQSVCCDCVQLGCGRCVQVRRTVKFLCGVARGLVIVTPGWLDRCHAAGKFVGECLGLCSYLLCVISLFYFSF